MFSTQWVARMGVTAAAVVLIGSMSVLLQGREGLKPAQRADAESHAKAAAQQVVYGEINTAMQR